MRLVESVADSPFGIAAAQDAATQALFRFATEQKLTLDWERMSVEWHAHQSPIEGHVNRSTVRVPIIEAV